MYSAQKSMANFSALACELKCDAATIQQCPALLSDIYPSSTEQSPFPLQKVTQSLSSMQISEIVSKELAETIVLDYSAADDDDDDDVDEADLNKSVSKGEKTKWTQFDVR